MPRNFIICENCWVVVNIDGEPNEERAKVVCSHLAAHTEAVELTDQDSSAIVQQDTDDLRFGYGYVSTPKTEKKPSEDQIRAEIETLTRVIDRLRGLTGERELCGHCGLPKATEGDWEYYEEGEGTHLCWWEN